jgi:hydrogenase-4 component F
MSEFLVVTSTFARQPWLALVLVLGLLIAFGALVRHVQGIAFGPAAGGDAPVRASLVPVYVHLTLVAAAGLYLPQPLMAWFQTAARLLG